MALKTMSIDKLIDLKQEVDAILATKVAQQRRALESELSKLKHFGAVRGGARGKVAAKYQNPDNPAETWAGRGLKPRWLAAALPSRLRTWLS